MTAPRPHVIPESRRAARVLRERASLPTGGRLRGAHVRGAHVRAAPARGAHVRGAPAHGAPVRHARAPRFAGIGVAAVAVLAAVFVLGSSAAVTAAVTDVAPAELAAFVASSPPERVEARVEAAVEERAVIAATVAELTAYTAPAPPPPAESAPDVCGAPAVATAMSSGDDAGVVAAAGGAATLRDAVALGLAPCVALDDPARVWVVVNKIRPYSPIDYTPGSLMAPEGVRNPEGGWLRGDAAAALTAMAAASVAEGAGEIGIESAYRSYATQIASHDSHVAGKGVETADVVSARPGFSEHQSGLAVDVVPCSAAGCGSIDALGASPQGAWLAARAADFGWIVRYESDQTPITGYLPEPWHLRYIGVDLATAYRDGGWHSLEEFFGIPAAPDYLP